MYYSIAIFYLLSSVSSFKFGDALKPRTDTNDGSSSDTWRGVDTSGHTLDTSNAESSDSISDGSKEIHLALSEEKKSNKYFKAHRKHHMRHETQKTVENVFVFMFTSKRTTRKNITSPTTLAVTKLNETDDVPTTESNIQLTTLAHVTQLEVQKIESQESSYKNNNQSNELNPSENQNQNQTGIFNECKNKISESEEEKQNNTEKLNQLNEDKLEINTNKSKQFDDLDKQDTSKQQLYDKIEEYNKDVQIWQEQMKNKTQEEVSKVNDIGSQPNKYKHHDMDKENNFSNETNKGHEEMHNKSQDSFASNFIELGNQGDTNFEGQKHKHKIIVNINVLPINHMQQQSNNMEKGANDTYNKIKDNVPLHSFTKNILTRTLKLFDKVKKRSTEDHWKKKVKLLAENYEDKYKEFLRSTNNQRIKTRLGTQKVILNAVDTSQNIVNRLVNMMVSEMDKKGLLRTSHTQDLFYKEIKNEVAWELQNACLNIGVCVTRSGYTQTIMDLLTKIVALDDVKFKLAFHSLTGAGKAADFSRSLGKRNAVSLKRIIANIERQSVNIQRAMVMIAKNIVANRNKPLVLSTDTDPVECNLNQTLAFLEIIDTLDKNVPDSKENMKKLHDIKGNMNGWSRGKNIQYTMDQFVSLTISVIDTLNGKAWNTVRRNANILFT